MARFVVWGGSHSPCLGPALGKHTSLFPDGRCLTNVCCWIGQGWPQHCQGPRILQDRQQRQPHFREDLGGPPPPPPSSLNRPEKGQEGRETLGAGRGRQSPRNWDCGGLAAGTGGTRKQSWAWTSASALSEVQFSHLYSEGPCLDLSI